MKHKCKEWASMNKEFTNLRLTDVHSYVSCYGPSITEIEYIEEVGIWVAHCDEYATHIKFCPFCGVEL